MAQPSILIYSPIVVQGVRSFEQDFAQFILQVRKKSDHSIAWEKYGAGRRVGLIWQLEPLLFNETVKDNVYQVRAATSDSQGNVSAFSSWVDETAGDSTGPPNPVLSSANRTVNFSTVRQQLSTYAVPDDFKEFQWYWSRSASSPDGSEISARTTQPEITIPIEGEYSDLSDYLYLWCRALDQSGNFNPSGWVSTSIIAPSGLQVPQMINMVRNGGFRNGVLAPWAITHNYGVSIEYSAYAAGSNLRMVFDFPIIYTSNVSPGILTLSNIADGDGGKWGAFDDYGTPILDTIDGLDEIWLFKKYSSVGLYKTTVVTVPSYAKNHASYLEKYTVANTTAMGDTDIGEAFVTPAAVQEVFLKKGISSATKYTIAWRYSYTTGASPLFGNLSIRAYDANDDQVGSTITSTWLDEGAGAVQNALTSLTFTVEADTAYLRICFFFPLRDNHSGTWPSSVTRNTRQVEISDVQMNEGIHALPFSDSVEDIVEDSGNGKFTRGLTNFFEIREQTDGSQHLLLKADIYNEVDAATPIINYKTGTVTGYGSAPADALPADGFTHTGGMS